MTFNTSGNTLRRGSSNTVNRDEELKAAVLERRVVVYLDEWANRRTLEARVFGMTRGERPVLIGFQLDAGYGVEPEKLWKVVDDLDRVDVADDAYETVERTLPAQYASQIVRFDAISPDTALDLTKYEADGY